MLDRFKLGEPLAGSPLKFFLQCLVFRYDADWLSSPGSAHPYLAEPPLAQAVIRVVTNLKIKNPMIKYLQ